MTPSSAARTRRLAAAVVAAAGVGVVVPAFATAAPQMVVGPRPFVVPSVSRSVTTGPASTLHTVTPFTAYHSKGRIAAKHPVTVPLASAGGLPAAGGFDAVAVTVTVSHPTTSTAATVFTPHAASATPVVTTSAKRAVTGFTVVAVNRAGAMRARLSKGHARLRIVVEGYQSSGSAGTSFHPLATATVLASHRVAGGAARRVSIVGAPHTGLPPNGHIAAVVLAVTAARPTATTTVTAYPRGGRARSYTAVSAHRGTSTSGVAIVPVGSHGDVMLRNAHGHATLGAAVEGYWTTDPTGSSYRSVTPTELYEGTTAANAWRNVRVAGRAGLPSAAGLSAAVLSITAGPPSAAAALTVAPTRAGFPSSGPVSVGAHRTVTTSVLARLTGRDVHIYATRRMKLTVSVVGWYGPTARGVDVNANSSTCRSSFPVGAGFAVIGANNGKPYNSPNAACFSSDTALAKGLLAAPQFYMNLADPGKASAGNWNNGGPRACHVARNYDAGCAYDYGYLAAAQAVGFARDHGMPAGSRWWVDVETDNSWGSATLGEPGHPAANIADIQGALRYLAVHGLPAGIYTETNWWKLVTGGSKAFPDVPVWGGGALTPKLARANCKPVSITGGPALLAQWFTNIQNTHDISC